MRRIGGLLVVPVICMLAGCGASTHSSTVRTPPLAPPTVAIRLTSPAFADGASIPSLYTCDGRDISPPLRWSGVPAGTRALTLVMRDPDAPGGNFVHWSLTGIRSSTTGIAAGAVPAGAVQGTNGFGTVGYRGPCPPSGHAHHYVITLSSSGGEHVAGSLTGVYARR